MRIRIKKPHIGSKWYRGNFSIGILIDSHPRFVNLIVALLFVEIVFGLYKKD